MQEKEAGSFFITNFLDFFFLLTPQSLSITSCSEASLSLMMMMILQTSCLSSLLSLIFLSVCCTTHFSHFFFSFTYCFLCLSFLISVLLFLSLTQQAIQVSFVPSFNASSSSSLLLYSCLPFDARFVFDLDFLLFFSDELISMPAVSSFLSHRQTIMATTFNFTRETQSHSFTHTFFSLRIQINSASILLFLLLQENLIEQ